MKVFVDSSVAVAAAGRANGASRLLFDSADTHHWQLLTSSYSLQEIERNLRKLSGAETDAWRKLRTQLIVVPDILSLDRIAVLPPSKDRPILFTALAHAHVLVTLDRRDFTEWLGSAFYELPLRTPGAFLRAQAVV